MSPKLKQSLHITKDSVMKFLWKVNWWIGSWVKIVVDMMGGGVVSQENCSEDMFQSERFDLINSDNPLNVYHD